MAWRSRPTASKPILLQYADNTVRLAGFVLPNRPTDIGQWVTSNESIDEIEDLTGLEFFEALPDDVEAEIEALNWSL